MPSVAAPPASFSASAAPNADVSPGATTATTKKAILSAAHHKDGEGGYHAPKIKNKAARDFYKALKTTHEWFDRVTVPATSAAAAVAAPASSTSAASAAPTSSSAAVQSPDVANTTSLSDSSTTSIDADQAALSVTPAAATSSSHSSLAKDQPALHEQQQQQKKVLDGNGEKKTAFVFSALDPALLQRLETSPSFVTCDGSSENEPGKEVAPAELSTSAPLPPVKSDHPAEASEAGKKTEHQADAPKAIGAIEWDEEYHFWRPLIERLAQEPEATTSFVLDLGHLAQLPLKEACLLVKTLARYPNTPVSHLGLPYNATQALMPPPLTTTRAASPTTKSSTHTRSRSSSPSPASSSPLLRPASALHALAQQAQQHIKSSLASLHHGHHDASTSSLQQQQKGPQTMSSATALGPAKSTADLATASPAEADDAMLPVSVDPSQSIAPDNALSESTRSINGESKEGGSTSPSASRSPIHQATTKTSAGQSGQSSTNAANWATLTWKKSKAKTSEWAGEVAHTLKRTIKSVQHGHQHDRAWAKEEPDVSLHAFVMDLALFLRQTSTLERLDLRDWSVLTDAHLATLFECAFGPDGGPSTAAHATSSSSSTSSTSTSTTAATATATSASLKAIPLTTLILSGTGAGVKTIETMQRVAQPNRSGLTSSSALTPALANATRQLMLQHLFCADCPGLTSSKESVSAVLVTFCKSVPTIQTLVTTPPIPEVVEQLQIHQQAQTFVTDLFQKVQLPPAPAPGIASAPGSTKATATSTAAPEIASASAGLASTPVAPEIGKERKFKNRLDTFRRGIQDRHDPNAASLFADANGHIVGGQDGQSASGMPLAASKEDVHASMSPQDTIAKVPLYKMIAHEAVQQQQQQQVEDKKDRQDQASSRFTVGSASDIGRRHEMQDTVSIKTGIISVPPIENSDPTAMRDDWIAIFDGHGSRQAADYCSLNLHHFFAEEMLQLIKEGTAQDAPQCIIQATKNAFEKCQKRLAAWSHSFGTTAVVAYISDAHLTIMNLGDSRAYLFVPDDPHLPYHLAPAARYSGPPASVAPSEAIAAPDGSLQLTTDHRPSNEYERALISARGGAITNDRVAGQLSVTRALGDADLHRWIIAVPEVWVWDLWQEEIPKAMNADAAPEMVTDQSRDMTSSSTVTTDATSAMITTTATAATAATRTATAAATAAATATAIDTGCALIVFGCDGIWEALEGHQAVAIAREAWRQASPSMAPQGIADDAARRIVRAASDAGSQDNLSCIVLYLGSKPSSCPTTFSTTTGASETDTAFTTPRE